jgi:hypothetical protein
MAISICSNRYRGAVRRQSCALSQAREYLSRRVEGSGLGSPHRDQPAERGLRIARIDTLVKLSESLEVESRLKGQDRHLALGQDTRLATTVGQTAIEICTT